MASFLNKKYQVIYIDPPWPVKKLKRKVRPNQIQMDYPVLSVKEIAALPIINLALEDCVLFLWTIQKYLPDAFGIMETWGFKYQITITWDKKNGMCLFGFHRRTEFLLMGYRGKIEMYPRRRAVPTLFSISSKKLRHSEKPKEIRKAIEIFGEVRIELFARTCSSGWDSMGYDIDGMDIRERLDKLEV